MNVSQLTLQRIETGKSSPSIILVSEIAEALNTTILSLLEPKEKSLVSLRRKQQKTISGPTSKVRMIGPRKMISNNIIVTYVELKKGQSIDPHTTDAIEYAYNLEGKCRFCLGDQTFFFEQGDAVAFDARLVHSVTALDDLKFIGIYFKDK